MRFSFQALRPLIFSLLLVSVATAYSTLSIEDDYPQTDTTASEESGSIFPIFRREAGGDEADEAAPVGTVAAPRGLVSMRCSGRPASIHYPLCRSPQLIPSGASSSRMV